MPSIRQKISFGFYIFVFIIALLALLTYSDLRYLGRRIDSGVVIYEFLDAVLEFRLHEEIYFLHGHEQSLRFASDYAERARKILTTNPEAFLALQSAGPLGELETLLGNYIDDLSRYGGSALPGEQSRQRLTRRIQQRGERLTTIAESLSRVERSQLRKSVDDSQWALLASVAIIALLGILAGRILSRVSLRPLAWMEAELAAIGDGRYGQLQAASGDLEIVSMSRAVNRMLDEIEVRNRHLMQAEKLASLGTLTSGIAHELNNPLSNISSSCQILMEEIGQGSCSSPMEWLEQIDGETQRAKHIVQSILEFSKENRLLEEEVDLRGLVDKSLLLLGQQGNFRIHRGEIPQGTRFTTDPQKLQQVFINLLQNAFDAGGPDVEIRIRARIMVARDFAVPQGMIAGKRVCTVNPDGRVVIIEVEDDGPGIPAEVLPRVFDPFFTTKGVGQGDGLGLFVVEAIVDLFGGCIAVGNDLPAGARFVLCLPCGEKKTPSMPQESG